MKKLLLLPAVALMMASCGGGDYCSCAEEAIKMASEAGDDAEKAKAATEKSAECVAMLPEDKAEAEKAMKECAK